MIVSDILFDSSYFSWKKNVELFGSFNKQYRLFTLSYVD